MAKHNNFLIYKDWWLFVENMSTCAAGELFKALFAYAVDGEITTTFSDAFVVPIYSFMIKHISENEEKYQQMCERNKEIRNRAVRKAKESAENCDENEQSVTSGDESSRNVTDKDNENENEKDNENVNVKENVKDNANVNVNGNEKVNAKEKEKEKGTVSENGKEKDKGFGEKKEENRFLDEFQALRRQKLQDMQ